MNKYVLRSEDLCKKKHWVKLMLRQQIDGTNMIPSIGKGHAEQCDVESDKRTFGLKLNLELIFPWKFIFQS